MRRESPSPLLSFSSSLQVLGLSSLPPSPPSGPYSGILPLNASTSFTRGQDGFAEFFSIIFLFWAEPPDIRNWFLSYEYDTPEPSGLSFGIGSHAGDSERTALSGEIQVLPPRDHGSNLQSRRPLERNRTPDLECIPIREVMGFLIS